MDARYSMWYAVFTMLHKCLQVIYRRNSFLDFRTKNCWEVIFDFIQKKIVKNFVFDFCARNWFKKLDFHTKICGENLIFSFLTKNWLKNCLWILCKNFAPNKVIFAQKEFDDQKKCKLKTLPQCGCMDAFTGHGEGHKQQTGMAHIAILSFCGI